VSSRGWVELSTLGDLLVRAAETWPERDAVVLAGGRHTFRSLLEASEAVAGSLTAIGVHPGDRIGIYMPTCMDFVETFFGCALTGVTPVLVNARFRAQEIAFVLQDSGAATVVTTDVAAEYGNYAGRLSEALQGWSLPLPPVLLGPPTGGFIDRKPFLAGGNTVDRRQIHAIRQQVRLSQPAVMPYTSGTTGNPKGCFLTHEAVMRVAIDAADRWDLSDRDRLWDPLPLFHIGGIFPLLAALHRGAAFVTTTHFDPQGAITQLAAERCTFAYPLFPTLMQSMITHPEFKRTDLSRVRLVVHAAPPETIQRVKRYWPQASVTSVYGCTECGGVVALGSTDDPSEKQLGTSGRPLTGVTVRIVDPESGADLESGRRGEILVKGPAVFQGYFNDASKTASSFSDGWFRTGDLGVMDADGFLTFQGRTKDMLKVGGENVAAAEIEAYLESHPSVKLAQVVGVPDQKYVEVPAAFIELIPGTQLQGDELRAFCLNKIAAFKVPRYFRVVCDWPMSSTKIQKFRLRQGLIDELQLQEWS
jgi:acyl-CoA synthetase (AMP-forming)/AMP-acid ligase II